MKFFLDIDGVMVHASPHLRVEMEEDGFYKFDAVAVQVLKSVVLSTKDELILSTSHRFRYSITQWLKIFNDRGIRIKKLSILDLPLETRSNRKIEITSWITINQIATNEVIIIDDDKSLNELPSYLKERLVLTNSYRGLDNDFDLKRILKRKKKKNFFL